MRNLCAPLKNKLEYLKVLQRALEVMLLPICFMWLEMVERLNYASYEPLKEAIEKKLTSSVKELSRVITRSRVRDKEQDEKYNAMVEQMKENGYCDYCCDVILKYAANNLWKD